VCLHGGPGTDSSGLARTLAPLAAELDLQLIFWRKFIIDHEYSAYDCRAELARIGCPTLVAVGRHDWICPMDQGEEITRLVPGAELAVFEHSGHSPQIEEGAAFTRRLAAFLSAAAPSR